MKRTNEQIGNKKRILAIGDIHGNFNLLKKLVEEVIKFNPEEDILVFLGDYIDRGFGCFAVVEYLKALRAKYPKAVFLLRGNHEQLALDSFNHPEDILNRQCWFLNGGRSTIESFKTLANCQAILEPFIKNLPYYLELDNFIFCHGGITGGSAKSCSNHALLWNREEENKKYTGHKMLIVGHTPQEVVCMADNKVVYVDTGAFATGLLSAYDVLNDCVYQAMTDWKRIELEQAKFAEMQEALEEDKATEEEKPSDGSLSAEEIAQWEKLMTANPERVYMIVDGEEVDITNEFKQIVT